MDGAVVAVAVGIDVEADVEIPAEVLPTAELDAAAGEAVPAAAALAFFAAARRFAALVAEEGVPEPEARAVAVK